MEEKNATPKAAAGRHVISVLTALTLFNPPPRGRLYGQCDLGGGIPMQDSSETSPPSKRPPGLAGLLGGEAKVADEAVGFLDVVLR